MQKHLDLIFEKKHLDPHSFLGFNQNTIRIFQPSQKKCELQINNQIVNAKIIDERGFFEYTPDFEITKYDYKIFYPNQKLSLDPYSFDVDLDDTDILKFKSSIHSSLYEILGAHRKTIKNIKGLEFSIWAPNAIGVSLIGDFNNWISGLFQLKNVKNSGIWKIFIPELDYGCLYKFEITTKNEKILTKTDPFAYFTELRPHNSAISYDLDEYNWEDSQWLEKRKKQDLNRGVNIYEVHLQSWIKGKEYFLNYKELAHKLAPYLKEMGFNYIELLPLMEHPLDDSWGYQTSGYFAITSRYGTPKDFQYFVDYMHKNDIGVILDWAPSHFPVDDFALSNFDGTNLFEMDKMHPEWTTKIFNFEKNEIKNFLISSAMFFIDKYHIDGLRVDAVSSMIYLDHARKDNKWELGRKGDNLNYDAIEFLKQLNSTIKEKGCDVLMIAEEATAYESVTSKKGLNFDLKWNMGWVHDSLSYFLTSADERKNKHNNLTFPIMYAFKEKFTLALSHDEFGNSEKSIFDRFPTDEIDKFANFRLLYSYMICQPGKKLSFMGFEIGAQKVWNNFEFLNWELLNKPLHKKFQNFVKDINHLYLREEAFYEDDFTDNGFEWLEFSDEKNSCISYFRKGKKFKKMLCIHNFSKNDLKKYFLKLEGFEKISLIFDTNREKYGGNDQNTDKIELLDGGIKLNVSKFSTLIFEVF